MRIHRLLAFAFLFSASLILGARYCAAQAGPASSIEFTAYVRPPEGQLEPVRGVTFYLLSKSLSDVRKEVETTEKLVDLDHFIAQLDVSMELQRWMKKHHRVDLAGDDFIKELAADDIVEVPEFLNAYTIQNGAALRAVVPGPKYKKGEEQKDAEKYKLHQEQYRQAVRRYVQANMDSLQGLDAELREVNPYPRWMRLQSDQQRHLEQRTLQFAQTHYLVATAETNLSGHAVFDNLTSGQYWVSNLDTPALAGDLRLHWDVGVTAPPAKTAHIELSNLNAVETSEQDAR